MEGIRVERDVVSVVRVGFDSDGWGDCPEWSLKVVRHSNGMWPSGPMPDPLDVPADVRAGILAWLSMSEVEMP